MKRIAFVVFTVIFLQACAVSKIDPTTLSPKADVKNDLPFQASLFIYVPLGEAEETLLMRYGYGNEHIFKTGELFQQAAMDIAVKYFEDVKNLSLTEDAHYVLKLEGETDVDIVWGVYTGEVKAKLYKSSGELVHETVVKETTVSGIIVDDNAVYNSYAKAVVKLMDEVTVQRGEEINDYISSTPATKITLSESSPLELVSTGSGFVVSKDGVVVTNDHVVSSCLSIAVSLNGQEYKADVKHVNKDLDIAILNTDLSAKTVAPIFPSESKIRLGEDVVAMGYPLHGVLSSYASLTTGNVSALKGIKDDENILQFTAPIQTGNSGGPLLNKKGEIIGVIQSKLNTIKLAQYTGDIAQNVNFAINGKELIKELDKSGVDYKVASKQNKDKATPDIAESATQYTVQVMCRG